MEKIIKKILLPAAALFLLVSCLEHAANNKEYIAKVDGTKITGERMNEELESLPEQARVLFMSQGETKELLNMIINQEILYQEAKKKDLEKDKRLREALEKFKKISMVKLLIAEEIEGKAQVSDEELKKYYEENKEEFRLNAPGRKEHGQLMSFDVVKELVRQRLVSEKQQKLFASYMDGLKKKYKVEINEAALQEFGKEAGPAEEGAEAPGEKAPGTKAPEPETK